MAVATSCTWGFARPRYLANRKPKARPRFREGALNANPLMIQLQKGFRLLFSPVLATFVIRL